jgi:hypothetical protein
MFRCRKTDNSNITVKFSKSEDQVSINNKRLYPLITKPETKEKTVKSRSKKIKKETIPNNTSRRSSSRLEGKPVVKYTK